MPIHSGCACRELEDRCRVALIRQQAAEQNKVYQSMLVMNGQHTEFNRLLGLGNELLQQRQGLVNVPVTAAAGRHWMINSEQRPDKNRTRAGPVPTEGGRKKSVLTAGVCGG